MYSDRDLNRSSGFRGFCGKGPFRLECSWRLWMGLLGLRVSVGCDWVGCSQGTAGGTDEGEVCRSAGATNVVSPPQPSPSVSRAVIPLHVSPLAPTGASIVSLWVGRSHRPGFAVFALASHTQLSPWQSHTHKHTLMAHLWVAGWGVRWNSVRQDFEFEEIEDYAFTDLWLM